MARGCVSSSWDTSLLTVRGMFGTNRILSDEYAYILSRWVWVSDGVRIFWQLDRRKLLNDYAILSGVSMNCCRLRARVTCIPVIKRPHIQRRNDAISINGDNERRINDGKLGWRSVMGSFCFCAFTALCHFFRYIVLPFLHLPYSAIHIFTSSCFYHFLLFIYLLPPGFIIFCHSCIYNQSVRNSVRIIFSQVWLSLLLFISI